MHKTIKKAQDIFTLEIKALTAVRDHLGPRFIDIFNTVSATKGKVIFTGIGKPGHIASKIAATFSSLGIASFYLHPTEAQHGDIGMVEANDLVIAISYSGESSEVLKLLPNIRLIGAKIIGITGNGASSLAKNCDLVEVFPPFEEAGPLKLAPTSSTTATLVYFDALALTIASSRNFSKDDFGKLHPAGALGRKLILKVSDLMITGTENAIASEDDTLIIAIGEMTGKPIGLLNVVRMNQELVGIITDGDIRRAINANKDLKTTTVGGIMTTSPIIIAPDVLAVDALALMVEKKVQSMPVVKKGIVVGTIQIRDILKEGISL